jgi:putative redox protein
MTQLTSKYLGSLRTLCTHESSGQTLQTDAPVVYQGKGEFFSPTDLVATALGSCMLTIMGMAATKAGVDITGATASVEKIMSTTPPRRIAELKINFTMPHPFSPETQELLEKAAHTCPVYGSLHPEIKKDINFSWGA